MLLIALGGLLLLSLNHLLKPLDLLTHLSLLALFGLALLPLKLGPKHLLPAGVLIHCERSVGLDLCYCSAQF